MENFYLYILQVNAALVIFYLLYRLLFVRDTFLDIRRLFLFSVVFLAFTYPGVSLSSWLEEQEVIPTVIVGYAELFSVIIPSVPVETPESFFIWQHVVLLIWGLGTGILFCRMLFQLVCICRMAIRGQRTVYQGSRLIALREEMAPFSFLNWIFVNPEHYEEKDLQEIILHEKAHVRGLHSIDMLLGELLCILFWFNPAIWLLRKEIRQNLEFLADKNVVSSGCNRKNYQYHLLRLSHQSTAVPIVNNFNVSQLKKRIIMMNRKKTSRIGLLKYALLLPVTGLLVLAGNAEVVAEIAQQTLDDKFTASQPTVSAGEIETLPVAVSKPDSHTIKGRVLDESGKPLPGVSVILQGQSIGVTTDGQGNFKMTLKDQKSGHLAFSYVGKETLSIPFDETTKFLNVSLKSAPVQLESLVVMGYGPQLEEKGEIFTVVEDMPRFKEGKVEQFLARYIKYPVIAQEAGIEGKVFVAFVIDKTGKVTNPRVIQSPNESLSQEAIRVIKMMPDWQPGMQRGIAVDVEYTMPIEFKISKSQSKVTVTHFIADSLALSQKGDEIKICGFGSPHAVSQDISGKEMIQQFSESYLKDKSKYPIVVVDGKK